MGKTGKYFEKKTVRLIKTLHPNSKVDHNVKLLGKLSKKHRQIDILVEPREFDILMFECKDHKRPISLDVFGSFTSLIEDVRIKKAAMVSNSPYSVGVQNLAKSKNIDLLHVVDTDDPKVRTRLKASVLLSDSQLKGFQMKFQSTGNLGDGISIYPNEIIIQSSEFKGNGHDYLKFLWNQTDNLPQETGNYKFEIENALVLSISGKPIPMDKITFFYRVLKEHFLGDLDILNTRGIYNVKEKSYQTKSLETAKLVPYEVEKIWKIIPEETAKQIKTTLGISCKSIY